MAVQFQNEVSGNSDMHNYNEWEANTQAITAMGLPSDVDPEPLDGDNAPLPKAHCRSIYAWRRGAPQVVSAMVAEIL